MENLITEEQYSQAHKEAAQWWDEVLFHNKRILVGIRSKCGDTTKEDYLNLLDFVDVDNKMEIVEQPTGSKQRENYGVFKNVHVEQWSVGDSGDSFAGFIYGMFKPNKWLKIPFHC